MRFLPTAKLTASIQTVILALAAIFIAVPAAQAQKQDNACAEGHFALANEDIETAIDRLEVCLETVDMTPDEEIRIYAELGAAFLTVERYQDAIGAYNFAFAIAETQQARITEPTLWRNRGVAYAELGRSEDALDDLLEAASMMPDDVMTQLTLGVVYQDLERPVEAVVAYDAVVRLEPDWYGAWLNRSGALLDAGMTGPAVEDARRAVELEPENGSTLNMLCWTLIKDGRAETALPLCEQAVEAEPDVGAIVHSLATALEALDRLDEAVPLFERAFELSPDDPEIASDYGRTHDG